MDKNKAFEALIAYWNKDKDIKSMIKTLKLFGKLEEMYKIIKDTHPDLAADMMAEILGEK